MPGTINVQGQLQDINGKTVPDGIIFSPSDYILRPWVMSHPGRSAANVSVVNGIFNIQLGICQSIQYSVEQANYYLGNKNGNEPEMSPRIPLTATPYSLMSKDVR